MQTRYVLSLFLFGACLFAQECFAYTCQNCGKQNFIYQGQKVVCEECEKEATPWQVFSDYNDGMVSAAFGADQAAPQGIEAASSTLGSNAELLSQTGLAGLGQAVLTDEQLTSLMVWLQQVSPSISYNASLINPSILLAYLLLQLVPEFSDLSAAEKAFRLWPLIAAWLACQSWETLASTGSYLQQAQLWDTHLFSELSDQLNNKEHLHDLFFSLGQGYLASNAVPTLSNLAVDDYILYQVDYPIGLVAILHTEAGYLILAGNQQFTAKTVSRAVHFLLKLAQYQCVLRRRLTYLFYSTLYFTAGMLAGVGIGFGTGFFTTFTIQETLNMGFFGGGRPWHCHG